MVCPSDVLKHWESILKQGDKLDDCIVVCSPSKTLRILRHAAVDGEGAFLSVGRLEASAEAVSFEPQAASAFVPEPGQKLAMLVTAGANSTSGQPNDDPATISCRLISSEDRADPTRPATGPVGLVLCRSRRPRTATAAPVFDGTGRVVGCVESATKTETRVVPVSRLALPPPVSP